jgi:F420-dependent oxidoreductase-like protein
MDHFFQIRSIGQAEHEMLEAYTTLGFLAAHTQQARLGTLVTGVHYRHPGVLIKQVTTLDVLSQGRANLGIGAGWYERESTGLGVPFPPLKDRFERLDETLQIAHAMFRGSAEPFYGKHFRLAEPINSPPPISQPHPPILVGGGGERKTLRLVAQYADACNLFGGPDEVAHKVDVLRRHCDAVGRDPNEIEVTALFRDIPEGGSRDEVVRGAESLAKVGVSTVVTGAIGDDPAAWLESTFGPAMESLGAIEATPI